MLLALDDRRLATLVGAGNEAAFEALYRRHHRGLLTFCRHMLRSREDAEDAVQQCFGRAFRALSEGDPPRELRPWLYTIARNRCLSLLAERRAAPFHAAAEVGTEGLSEQVERRADLRALVGDVAALPGDQRAALVLFELGALPQREIAQVLDCEPKRVKALVYQARQSLATSREAREVSCREIRERLATSSGAALRGGLLRRHLKSCPGCRAFQKEVRAQRAALALALPAVPSAYLKSAVLGAAGTSAGGSAGGGLIAALAAKTGATATAVKAGVAALAVGVVASGSAATFKAIDAGRAGTEQQGAARVTEGGATPAPATAAPQAAGVGSASQRAGHHSQRGAHHNGQGAAGKNGKGSRSQATQDHRQGQGRGRSKQGAHANGKVKHSKPANGNAGGNGQRQGHGGGPASGGGGSSEHGSAQHGGGKNAQGKP